MPEVAFLKWQKENAERTGFSWVRLLKGLGSSNEITRQQVQSRQRGAHIPQHLVSGLHGSAPPTALPAGD